MKNLFFLFLSLLMISTAAIAQDTIYISKHDTLFGMVKDLKPNDRVKCIAYSVCCAFLIGDHLAFTANFQPSLIFPVMLGKFCAGCLAVYIATKFLKFNILKTNNNG